MKLSLAALLALAAMAGQPAMAAPVQVLNAPASFAQSSSGNTAQTQTSIGPYSVNAVVFVTADGESRFSAGGGVNAGIVVVIAEIGPGVPPRTIRDDSFEGESSNLRFYAAASHVFLLPRGQTRRIQASVVPTGAGGSASNTNTAIRMDVVALAAQ